MSEKPPPRFSDKQPARQWRQSTAASRRPHGDPTLLSSILPAVSKAMHLPEKVAEMAVLRLWPEVAPADCPPSSTRAVAIKRSNGKAQLVVMAANAHIATQLSYQGDGLLSRLNQYFPQTGLWIDKLTVRVGSRREQPWS